MQEASESLFVGSTVLARAIDLVCCGPTHTGDFLEVKCLDEREKLVFRILDGVINQSIGKEYGVVGHLDLGDRFSNAHLELLLSLNSVTDPASQLLKAGWVNEEEVALKGLPINLLCSLDIDLDDWDLTLCLDVLQLSPACSIPASLGSLTALNELIVVHHGLETLWRNEQEVLLRFLIAFTHRPRCHGLLASEDVSVLFEHEVD